MAIRKGKTNQEKLAQMKSIGGAHDEDEKKVTIEFVFDGDDDESNPPYVGQELFIEARLHGAWEKPEDAYFFKWKVERGQFKETRSRQAVGKRVTIKTNSIRPAEGENGDQENCFSAAVEVWDKETGIPTEPSAERQFCLREPTRADLKGNFDEKMDEIVESVKNSNLNDGHLNVSLTRTAVPPTPDLTLWTVIRRSTQAISFENYADFIDLVLFGTSNNIGARSRIGTADDGDDGRQLFCQLQRFRAMPFNDTDAYRLLKVATEAFLLVNAGVKLSDIEFDEADLSDLRMRMGSAPADTQALNLIWSNYLVFVAGTTDLTIPYLALLSEKFRHETFKNQVFSPDALRACYPLGTAPEEYLKILRNKLTHPFLIELIWSYWHEEGMLVQTINAISRRFQNVRAARGSRDPLASLEIDALRPVNNLLWGYVQDEPHRLSLVRRVYEYEHQYGITLQGKAVPKSYPADSRSKFIEAFHHLLHLSAVFFKRDDDTTVNADGFPLLNALREVSLILAQGAHNQFGDLPSTARQEMLIQQWLLARPEFREFLPTRLMLAYNEPWMDRVDAMKSLQGWSDVSTDHFHRLAVFGEQLLLSIRFGAWIGIEQTTSGAANWARFWRSEIQGYIHDYRAVTGVDLSSSARVDSTPPSILLYRRYLEQARR